MTTSPAAVATEFSRYTDWTAEYWNEDEAPLTLRDLAIMSLGLAGEAAEVSELLLAPTGQLDTPELRLELGDVVYYWCRICHAFGLPAASLWLDASTTVAGAGASDIRSAATLGVAAGKAIEVLKKHVRDGGAELGTFLPPAALAARMVDLAREVIEILRHHKLELLDVTAENESKLKARRARKRALRAAS